MTLWDLEINKVCKIKAFLDVKPIIKTRLNDLGFNLNSEIVCLRKSPLGGPKTYQNSSGAFAIEQDVAQNIRIELK